MSNLAQLKQSVDNWLARDDIAVSGTDFTEIMLIAESNLARDLRLITQELSTDLVFTGRSADLPANFMGPRTPFIDDNVRKFEYKTPEAIREAKSWNDGRVGAFYTIEGSNDATASHDDRAKMTIAGPASATSPLTVTINYHARLDPLTQDTDTNWLLTNHFDIYLYALLFAACEYTRELSLAQYYEGKYMKVVNDQNKTENRKRYGGNAKQTYGSPRGIV